MSGRIDLTRLDQIAEITLNRPEKLNAMTPQMAADLRDVCMEVDSDPNVHVVILCGAGERAFSAGSDIKALDEYDGPYDFRNRIEYATQIRNLRKPCIAMMHGWALGGGLEMALNADIRVCAESARLGAPEVSLGWVGAGGASQLVPRLAGYGRAMLLLLQGDPITAPMAEEWGLIDLLVPDEELRARTYEIAEKIAGHDPIATQTVKAAVRQSLSTPLEAGIRYENEVMTLAFALGADKKGRDDFKGK